MKSIKKISLIILFAVLFSVFAFVLTVSAEVSDGKANPSGAYLKYTVDVNKKDSQSNPNLAFSFMTLKKLDYVIEEGDMLEYDVYSLVDEKGWGAIDGDIAGVGTIRDSGLSDEDGNGIHTGVDLSGDCFEQWYHRVIPFGVTEDENGDKYTAGRTLKQIQLAMHPESGENGYQGVVLYDNIIITNNGEIKLVVFRDESDFVPGDIKSVGSQGTKGAIEMLVFTAGEEQEFKEAEERAIKEQESREAAKAEAEASRQASIEQASIDASIAESEAVNNTEAINEPANDSDSSSDDDDGGLNTGIFIGVGAGVVVLAVIIIVIVGAGKKKSK